MMKRKAPAGFRALKRQTENLLAPLKQLGQRELEMREAEGTWSRLDVLDHLVKTEQGILMLMALNLARGGNPISAGDRWRNRVLLLVMLAPVRVKVPAQAKVVQPDGTRTELAPILAEWAEVRREMEAFLTELSPEAQSTGVFRHPAGGWMSADGAIDFLRAHLHHHGYQLKRIQKAIARQSGPTGPR